MNFLLPSVISLWASIAGRFYQRRKLGHWLNLYWAWVIPPQGNLLTAPYFLVIGSFSESLHEDIGMGRVRWTICPGDLPQLKDKIRTQFFFLYIRECLCMIDSSEAWHAVVFAVALFLFSPKASFLSHILLGCWLTECNNQGHSSAMWQYQWYVPFYYTLKSSFLCKDSFTDRRVCSFF